MGSCISKCRPKPPPPIVHDKLVLVASQQAKAKDPPILKSTHSFSPSSSSCTTSLSATTSTSFTKSPLSSTCSSSISNSNYTNDFLWSYGKENRIRNQSLHYSVKTSPVKSVSIKIPGQVHVGSSIPSKRSRANSPTLTRQKSFKRESEGVLHRGRSSPSRRFNCESTEAVGRNGFSSSPGRRGCADVLEASRSHNVTGSIARRNMVCSSPSRRFNSGGLEPVQNSAPQRNMVYSSPSRRFNSGGSEPVKNSVPHRNMISSSPKRRFDSGVSEPLQNSVPQRNVISSSPSRRFHTHTSHSDKQHVLPNPLNLNSNSSSSSRKYNHDLCRDVPKNRHTEVGTKRDNASIWSSTKNKDNLPASSWNNTVRDESSPMKTETCTHQIDTRTDQDTDVVMVSNQDCDPLPIDDIDNPLISLDCFIFL